MICIWSSWCHCHPIICCCSKIQNGLPFWCLLTQVVLEKRLLNGCSRHTSSYCQVSSWHYFWKQMCIWQSYHHRKLENHIVILRPTWGTILWQVQIYTIKYSRYMTCQSNSPKGRGHHHLPKWDPKDSEILVKQQVTSCLKKSQQTL